MLGSDIYLILGMVALSGDIFCMWILLRVFFLVLRLDVSRKIWILLALVLFLGGISLEISILTSYVLVIFEEGYASLLFPKYRAFWCLICVLYILSAIVLILHISSSSTFVVLPFEYTLPILVGILFAVTTIWSARKRLWRIAIWGGAGTIYGILLGLGFLLWSQILLLLAVILRSLIIVIYLRY